MRNIHVNFVECYMLLFPPVSSLSQCPQQLESGWREQGTGVLHASFYWRCNHAACPTQVLPARCCFISPHSSILTVRICFFYSEWRLVKFRKDWRIYLFSTRLFLHTHVFLMNFYFQDISWCIVMHFTTKTVTLLPRCLFDRSERYCHKRLLIFTVDQAATTCSCIWPFSISPWIKWKISDFCQSQKSIKRAQIKQVTKFNISCSWWSVLHIILEESLESLNTQMLVGFFTWITHLKSFHNISVQLKGNLLSYFKIWFSFFFSILWHCFDILFCCMINVINFIKAQVLKESFLMKRFHWNTIESKYEKMSIFNWGTNLEKWCQKMS